MQSQTLNISLDWIKNVWAKSAVFYLTAKKQQNVCQSSVRLYVKKSPVLFQNVLAQLYHDEFDMNTPLKDLFSQTKQSPIEKKTDQ